MTIVKPLINRHLVGLLGKEELIDTWWNSPNKAFDMNTPDQVYQSGEDGRKRVFEYVMRFSYGP